jgi:hypothetical protein
VPALRRDAAGAGPRAHRCGLDRRRRTRRRSCSASRTRRRATVLTCFRSSGRSSRGSSSASARTRSSVPSTATAHPAAKWSRPGGSATTSSDYSRPRGGRGARLRAPRVR